MMDWGERELSRHCPLSVFTQCRVAFLLLTFLISRCIPLMEFRVCIDYWFLVFHRSWGKWVGVSCLYSRLVGRWLQCWSPLQSISVACIFRLCCILRSVWTVYPYVVDLWLKHPGKILTLCLTSFADVGPCSNLICSISSWVLKKISLQLITEIQWSIVWCLINLTILAQMRRPYRVVSWGT